VNKDQPQTNTFGVPIPDNTPMGDQQTNQQIRVGRVPTKAKLQMQGKMLHGIATHPHGRSMFVRILAILFCLVCLLGPGALFLVVATLAYAEGGVMAIIVPGVLGLIFIGGGISGIVANVRKAKG
jgi:hypothetical protein